MSKSKRNRDNEFPNLKFPEFASSSRRAIGRETDPLAKAGKAGRGYINTDWEDVDWTPSKIIAASIGLGLPYLAAILVTFVLGMKIITDLLLGIAILVAFLFVFVRWIDKA